jgi:hypothetical protein
MGKSDVEDIALFNEQVNMTANELKKWLEPRFWHRRLN